MLLRRLPLELLHRTESISADAKLDEDSDV